MLGLFVVGNVLAYVTDDPQTAGNWGGGGWVGLLAVSLALSTFAVMSTGASTAAATTRPAAAAMFAGQLRSQIDLDALDTELIAAINRTVQPSHVTLWLRR